MSPVGETQDVGWEIGVSRTLPVTIEEAWAAVTSAPGVRAWLGEGVWLPLPTGAPYETADGTVGEVRSFHPLDRVRLTMQPAGWDHETTVQLALTATKTGTIVRFHQERLADADERNRQRTHWRGVLDAVAALLDS